MRIALLTDGIHPYVIGGMQKHSFLLARELARQCHTIDMFHCNKSNYDASKLEFFSEEEKKHINSYLIPFPEKAYYPLHYISESHQYSEAVYKTLSPILPKVDFIFAQGFCSWALLEHKPQSARPPVAVHFHGFEMFQHIPSVKAKVSSYFLRQAVKKNLAKTDYAISYGGKITTILSQLIDKGKIWEIPAGIEKSWLTEPTSVGNKVRFVFIGRYERRKALPELNEAIKELLPKYSFSFDFIGDIPDEHKIKHEAIKYHGKLSTENDIKKILRNCDVLVCPSYAEGMPNVIMETMACGLAIIATDTGAVSLLVDEENGSLIENPHPKKILQAILAMLNDKNIQRKRLNSFNKIRNNFLIEKVSNELIANMLKSINKSTFVA
jgi:glycosyltransferase involved in cell wall biosynthesis